MIKSLALYAGNICTSKLKTKPRRLSVLIKLQLFIMTFLSVCCLYM